MKFYVILLIIGVLALFTSCDKEEPPPSYIHFDQITFEQNPDASLFQGSLRQRMPNVYVTINDESNDEPAQDIGFQNIPSTFPYLGVGPNTITVRPSVPVNGNNASIIEYPFFEAFVLTNYELELFEIDTISLTTRYRSEAEIDILFNEDFEQNSSIFREYALPEMEGLLVNQIEDVYEGVQSGRIHLDETNRFIDVATTGVYPLDLNEPYLEMDYKTDVLLSFGLIGNDGGNTDFSPVGFLAPKETWNKVYFQMKDAVSYLQSRGFSNFQVYYSAALGGTMTEADIHLDNVKLLKQK
ncbi:MAG: hypothetical protein ACI9JY_000350 [Saprospiraceae bacterium]|jgi:hypothetical protein